MWHRLCAVCGRKIYEVPVRSSGNECRVFNNRQIVLKVFLLVFYAEIEWLRGEGM